MPDSVAVEHEQPFDTTDEPKEVGVARAALLDPPKAANRWLVLVGSLLLFALVALPGNGFAGVVVLAIVIGIHELGHLAAMRLCGYSDLRIFFIPFFGAAASGRRYGAPGWQQALISLAGPVPGILVGAGLAVVSAILAYKPLGNAAFTFLFVNAYNLLPVSPLDGGRLFERILFGRRAYLLVGFQVLAVGALAWLGINTDNKVLIYVAALVFIGIPATYRTMRASASLRERFGDLPADPRQLEPVQLLAIADCANSIERATSNPGSVAKHCDAIRSVYSQALTKPPRIWASAGLAALWLASLAIALVGIVIAVAVA